VDIVTSIYQKERWLMTVNDMYLDQIQDEQDKHILKRQQFAEYNTPKRAKTTYDFYGDEVTSDEEVWMTDDGLVVMHNLVEYCNDKFDKRVVDTDMAIDTIEDNGGYAYDINR